MGSFLFFPLFGEPILEIFGEYLHVSFFRNVVDGCGGNFELYHSLVRPLPKSFLFGGGVGQVKLGHQLTEFGEHYRIEVVVIPRDYFPLICGTFVFSHKFPFRIENTSFTGNFEINQAADIIKLVFAGFGQRSGYNSDFVKRSLNEI